MKISNCIKVFLNKKEACSTNGTVQATLCTLDGVPLATGYAFFHPTAEPAYNWPVGREIAINRALDQLAKLASAPFGLSLHYDYFAHKWFAYGRSTNQDYDGVELSTCEDMKNILGI